jgi:hypothetical protein
MRHNVDSHFLLEVLKLEYNNRVLSVLEEAEVFDAEGNLLIQPDLKVRHKSSGYEYTVDKVLGDRPGSVQIVLRDPGEPRFNPPSDGAEVLGGLEDEMLAEDDELIAKNVAAIDNLHTATPDTVDSDSSPDTAEDEVVFIIDQTEFEKEYEVD